MSFDEFFTDQDKPFAENLNDSLVLTDAFDLSVPLCMPDGFSNGEFNSTLNVTRKCNVGLVTLKSVGSGVTVGTSQISGSGEVVFRVYPNFNCFYKWDKIIVEKSGTVDISFRKPDGSSITATVGSDGTISDSSALKQLVEVDLVLTLSNASISQICVWFVNNQSTSRVRTGALLEASQLVNVNGQVSDGESRVVNGGTVKTALDNLHSVISDETDDKLNLKEDLSNKVTVLDSSDTHYPTANAVKTVTDNSLNLIKDLIGLKVSNVTKTDGYLNMQFDLNATMGLTVTTSTPPSPISYSETITSNSFKLSDVHSQLHRKIAGGDVGITVTVVHTATNYRLFNKKYTL